jgi:hypothetical protein
VKESTLLEVQSLGTFSFSEKKYAVLFVEKTQQLLDFQNANPRLLASIRSVQDIEN